MLACSTTLTCKLTHPSIKQFNTDCPFARADLPSDVVVSSNVVVACNCHLGLLNQLHAFKSAFSISSSSLHQACNCRQTVFPAYKDDLTCRRLGRWELAAAPTSVGCVREAPEGASAAAAVVAAATWSCRPQYRVTRFVLCSAGTYGAAKGYLKKPAKQLSDRIGPMIEAGRE